MSRPNSSIEEFWGFQTRKSSYTSARKDAVRRVRASQPPSESTASIHCGGDVWGSSRTDRRTGIPVASIASASAGRTGSGEPSTCTWTRRRRSSTRSVPRRGGAFHDGGAPRSRPSASASSASRDSASRRFAELRRRRPRLRPRVRGSRRPRLRLARRRSQLRRRLRALMRPGPQRPGPARPLPRRRSRAAQPGRRRRASDPRRVRRPRPFRRPSCAARP
jgi:hypothetical protein